MRKSLINYREVPVIIRTKSRSPSKVSNEKRKLQTQQDPRKKDGFLSTKNIDRQSI